MTVLVIAGSKADAERWRKEQGLKPKDVVYATQMGIRGLRPTRIVQHSSFDVLFDHWTWQEARWLARMHGLEVEWSE